MTAEQTGARVVTPRLWDFLSEDELAGWDLAEEFHEASKFYRSTIGRMIRWDALQTDARLQQSAARGARELPHLPLTHLPEVDHSAEHDAMRQLIRRPSCQQFRRQRLSDSVLGSVLWLSYGTYPGESLPNGGRRRPVASGGGLYPLEIYIIADVQDRGQKGLYHYNVHRHGLEELRASVSTSDLQRLGRQGELLVEAPAVVLITSLFWRSRFKYGLRGYRFAVLEAGALIQQLSLVAQSLGLGVLPFAGLYDDVVEELCEINGVDESFLNAVILGYPR